MCVCVCVMWQICVRVRARVRACVTVADIRQGRTVLGQALAQEESRYYDQRQAVTAIFFFFLSSVPVFLKSRHHERFPPVSFIDRKRENFCASFCFFLFFVGPLILALGPPVQP